MTLAPAQFPITVDITSQALCHGTQSFTAIVRDARGLTDTESAEISCELPASGSEIYLKKLPGVTESLVLGVAILPDGDAVYAGRLDGRMALWRLAPSGEVRPDWPKQIGSWTADPALAALPSTATAIAADATGGVVVVGVLGSGATARRYAVKLGQNGARIWEDAGSKAGEEASGVAISASGDILVVGTIRTSLPADPEALDTGVWGYPLEAERWSDQLGAPADDPEPDLMNTNSERGRAAAFLANGEFVIVGERELRIDIDLSPARSPSATRERASARATCGPRPARSTLTTPRGRSRRPRPASCSPAGAATTTPAR